MGPHPRKRSALVDEAERAGKARRAHPHRAGRRPIFRASHAGPRQGLDHAAMEPQPWLPQRMTVLKAWQAASDAPKTGRFVWLTDGIAGGDGKDFAKALAERASSKR